ncbi:hypothetical protein MSG37_10600 [Shewanella sp. 1CM18E]|uniref:hypothetical protein n=1 Tax=Shewanella sp. 1CM18E TaxID=2929169 RepID=UPI0020C0FECA|nr:hypothetical protein [Shewanella sp. 1CM18E]MCK8045340.1 hypothetical protein [Shewanella sp. 1CM18E]
MKTSIELVAPTLTPAEFKSQIINFIGGRDFKAELLRQILSALPDDKHDLFEDYRTDVTTDPISDDSYKWEREGGAYFSLQLHMAEENFCLKRLEHLIVVKSHLTERGIAGFSRPTSIPSTNQIDAQRTKENTMSADFSSEDLTGFTPSRSLNNCVNNDDISTIRIALFMEMNDKRLSTAALRRAIAWTLSKHPNLFVAYEENAYSQDMVLDSTKWNKDYYHMQEVYASSNFSLERIWHMVAVRDQVFTLAEDEPRSATAPSTRPQSMPKQTHQHRDQPSTGRTQRTESKPQNNVLNSLLLIGGVVAAIALVILAVIV